MSRDLDHADLGDSLSLQTNTSRAKPYRKFEDCSFSRSEDNSWGVKF